MKLKTYVGKPAQIHWLKRAVYATLGVLVVADLLITREHAAFIWDAIPGFYAFYGFISTILIIVVSKLIGHAWLMKYEDYYD